MRMFCVGVMGAVVVAGQLLAAEVDGGSAAAVLAREFAGLRTPEEKVAFLARDVATYQVNERYVTYALKLLHDADAGVRARAMTVLVTHHEKSVMAEILGKADDPDPRIRAAVAYAMSDTAGAHAGRLLEYVEKDPDAGVRNAAVHAACLLLNGMAAEEARKPVLQGVVQCLADPVVKVRTIKSLSLAGITREEGWAREKIAEALRDNELRLDAIETLVSLRATDRVGELRVLLDDADPQVRYAVERALVRLGDKAVLPRLLAVVSAGDRVPEYAVEGIGMFGDVSHAAVVARLLRDESGVTRGRAAEMLALWNATAYFEAARRVLQDPDAMARLLAVRGVPALYGREAAGVLAGMLTDKEVLVRGRVLSMLLEMKAYEQKAAVEGMLEREGNEGIRRAAREFIRAAGVGGQ